jgi:hypothetical protein
VRDGLAQAMGRGIKLMSFPNKAARSATVIWKQPRDATLADEN